MEKTIHPSLTAHMHCEDCVRHYEYSQGRLICRDDTLPRDEEKGCPMMVWTKGTVGVRPQDRKALGTLKKLA